jgi:hypothetical protein
MTHFRWLTLHVGEREIPFRVRVPSIFHYELSQFTASDTERTVITSISGNEFYVNETPEQLDELIRKESAATINLVVTLKAKRGFFARLFGKLMAHPE